MISATLSILATIFLLSQLTTAAHLVVNVHHTFYGYPDNSPPGAATAYDCGYNRGYTAGGDGSFSDPLTFASAPGEFDKCEVIWDRYTQKYLVFQDTCAACIDDWKKGIRHVDLWLGSPTQNAHKVVKKCERALTPNEGQVVVRGVSKGLEADSKLRFGTLMMGNKY